MGPHFLNLCDLFGQMHVDWPVGRKTGKFWKGIRSDCPEGMRSNA
jgi:hypothetical protein